MLARLHRELLDFGPELRHRGLGLACWTTDGYAVADVAHSSPLKDEADPAGGQVPTGSAPRGEGQGRGEKPGAWAGRTGGGGGGGGGGEGPGGGRRREGRSKAGERSRDPGQDEPAG